MEPNPERTQTKKITKQSREVVQPERFIDKAQPVVRLAMQVVISLALLSAGLWILLAGHFDDTAQKWGAGAIGTVVGFWLNEAKK